MRGASAERSQVKYYQLKNSKRVVINAQWVNLTKPADGQTNNGRIIGRVPDSLKPAYRVTSAVTESITAGITIAGDILIWVVKPSNGDFPYSTEIKDGTLTLNFDYETN